MLLTDEQRRMLTEKLLEEPRENEIALSDNWLFSLVDENGEAHFCRLVAEFLEALK